MAEGRRGVYPGTFDPLTVAHLAIADAAVHQLGLDSLDLVLSVDPIGKDTEALTALDARLDEIRARISALPWLEVRTSELRLVSDIAAGYDVCVLGADKWEQVLDPSFHASPADHDAALERLPLVAVAPRSGSELVPAPASVGQVVVLDLPLHLGEVSSTAVRDGRIEWRA